MNRIGAPGRRWERLTLYDGLIDQLMFDTGPYVHGDRSKLDFRRHDIRLAAGAHRYSDDQVEAAVSALLGLGDVVVFLDDFKRRGRAKKSGEAIYGLRAAKNHAQAGDVLQCGMGAGGGCGKLLFEELSANGCRRFETEGDGAYIADAIHMASDAAEYFENRFHSTLIGKKKLGRKYAFCCDPGCVLLYAGSRGHDDSPRISKIRDSFLAAA